MFRRFATIAIIIPLALLLMPLSAEAGWGSGSRLSCWGLPIDLIFLAGSLAFFTLGGGLYWFVLGNGRRYIGMLVMSLATILAIITTACWALGDPGPSVIVPGVILSISLGVFGCWLQRRISRTPPDSFFDDYAAHSRSRENAASPLDTSSAESSQSPDAQLPPNAPSRKAASRSPSLFVPLARPTHGRKPPKKLDG
jgi:hypothetical protein